MEHGTDGLTDDFCFELDEEGRISGTSEHVDCSTKVCDLMELKDTDDPGLLDDLTTDCALADCGLVKDTFWLPAAECYGKVSATGSSAREAGFRCSLEALAARIFQHHTQDVPEDVLFSAGSGAEWWVQIKTPGDETPFDVDPGTDTHGEDEVNEENVKRKAVPGQRGSTSLPKKHKSMSRNKASMCFHWDKDEALHASYGFYLHPLISTVTYLSGALQSIANEELQLTSAPTIVLDRTVSFEGGISQELIGDSTSTCSSVNTTDKHVCPNPKSALCFPRIGQHLSFDGRLLHAAPLELRAAVVKSKEKARRETVNDHDDKVGEARTIPVATIDSGRYPRERITFLVNIWLQHRPNGIRPFPSAMVGKLTRRYNRRLIDSPMITPAVQRQKDISNSGSASSCIPYFPPLEPVISTVPSSKPQQFDHTLVFPFSRQGTAHAVHLRFWQHQQHEQRDSIANPMQQIAFSLSNAAATSMGFSYLRLNTTATDSSPPGTTVSGGKSKENSRDCGGADWCSKINIQAWVAEMEPIEISQSKRRKRTSHQATEGALGI